MLTELVGETGAHAHVAQTALLSGEKRVVPLPGLLDRIGVQLSCHRPTRNGGGA